MKPKAKKKNKKIRPIDLEPSVMEVHHENGKINRLGLFSGIVLGLIGLRYIWGFTPDWFVGGLFELASAFFIIKSFPPQVMASAPLGIRKPDEIKPFFFSFKNKIIWMSLVLFMIAGQVEFRRDLMIQGWILTLVGLAIVIGLGKIGGGGEESKIEISMNETFWFWAILIGAAILRFSLLRTNFTGLQGDEANNLNDAIGVVEGKVTSPFVTGWGGTPTFPDYIVAFFFKIFGINLWAARLVSLLASLIAIGFFNRWCRFWMGNLASLMATFFLAVSWWFLYFSFSTFHNSLLLMWEIMAFYFLEKGFREGKRLDFWWTGFCVAACLMNYVAGRSVPVAMFVTIFGYILIRKDGFLKTYWKSLLLILLSCLWFAGPYLLYAIHYSYEIWGRVKPDWIFYEAKQTGNYFFLLKSYFWTFCSLFVPDHSIDLRFVVPGLPFLDPFAAGFLLMGLTVCLFNLRQPISWVVLPGFFLGLSANALARIDLIGNLAYVQSVRYSIVIPFAFLVCGWGFEWLLRIHRSFFGQKWGWMKLLTLAALVGGLALNAPLFVSHYGQDSGSWGDIGMGQIKEAQIINAHPEDYFMIESVSLGPAIYFLTHDKETVSFLSFDRDIPIEFKVTKDVMLLFSPWRISPQQTKKLKATYPKGVWTEYNTPFGSPYLISDVIPLDEILQRQKGKILGLPPA